jgi:hypothetical protein
LPPYQYQTHLLYCAQGTYWSHDKLTCTKDIPDSSKCEFIPDSTHKIPVARDCELTPGPYPNSFYQQGILRTCPAGTIFHADNCACILKQPPICGDLVLYMPYDKDFNDKSCNMAVGDVYGKVTLSSVNVHRGHASACFNGMGYLQYNLLSNYFNMKDIKGWTISLFLLSDIKQNANLEGILNQKDSTSLACESPFELHLSPGSVHGKIIAEGGSATVYGPWTPNVWNHIALRYDGSNTDLFINGVKHVSSPNANGALINSKCPLTVGWKGLTHLSGFLNAYVDEIKIFKSAKSDAFILSL